MDGSDAGRARRALEQVESALRVAADAGAEAVARVMGPDPCSLTTAEYVTRTALMSFYVHMACEVAGMGDEALCALEGAWPGLREAVARDAALWPGEADRLDAGYVGARIADGSFAALARGLGDALAGGPDGVRGSM